MKNFFFRLLVAVGLLALLALLWFALREGTVTTILSGKTEFIVPILLLFGLTFALKAARWQNLLKTVSKTVLYRDAFVSWCSGYFLSYFTPGKIAEPIRALLYKQLTGISSALTAPLVIMERLTDFVFFLLVALVGIVATRGLEDAEVYGIVILVLTAILALLFLLRQPLLQLVFWGMKKIGGLEKQVPTMQTVFFNLSKSVHSQDKKSLTVLGITTITVWVLEALVIVLIVASNNATISLELAMVALCISTIASLISSIPAGLGVMEISLSGVLVLFGVPTDAAFATAILYRAYSLLFLGIAGIPYFAGLRKKRIGAAESTI